MITKYVFVYEYFKPSNICYIINEAIRVTRCN